MTLSIKLTATPIPNGYEGGKLSVSVVFHMTGTASGTTDLPNMCNHFSQYLKNSDLSFLTLQWNNCGPNLIEDTDAWRKKIDAIIWEKLIGNKDFSAITPHKTSNYPTISYSMQHLRDRFIKSCWSSFVRTTDKNAEIPTLISIQESVAIDLAKTFHGITPTHEPLASKVFNTDQVIPARSIEALVSTLLKAPLLARKTGLILDFLVDPPEHTHPITYHLSCSLNVPDNNVTTETISVACEIDSQNKIFVPATKSQVSPKMILPYCGLLNARDFSNNGYRLFAVEFDVIGEMFRESRSIHANSSVKDVTEDEPFVARNPGISVNIKGANADLQAALSSPTQPFLLYAEDMINGYRVDVSCDESGFNSLCQRKVEYTYTDIGEKIPLDIDIDEGFVEMHPLVDNVLDENNLRLHETLAHWDGMSLVVPRIRAKNAPSILNDANPESFIKTKSSVLPGSLTRLRTGKNYRFRVRPVFAGGVGMSADAADKLMQRFGDFSITAPVRAVRSDPIGPPQILLPGDNQSSPPANEKLTELYVYEGNDYSYRNILPPPISFGTAEFCGVFDALGRDTSKDVLLSLMDKPVDQHRLGHYLPEPWVHMVEAIVTITSRSGMTSPRSDKIEPECIQLTGSESDSIPIQLSFGTKPWPTRHGFKLNIHRRAKGPSVVKSPKHDGNLNILLAPGDSVKITLRSVIDPQYVTQTLLSQVGALIMKSNSFKVNDQKLLNALKEHIPKSPIATGKVTLFATHALPSPAFSPLFSLPQLVRKKGIAIAQIVDSIAVDGATTSSVVIHALWKDFDDTLEKRGEWCEFMQLSTPPLKLAATDYALALSPSDTTEGIDIIESPNIATLAFTDTRARKCTIWAVANARYSPDFFAVAPNASNAKKSQDHTVVVLATAPPAMPNILYSVPLYHWEYKNTEITHHSIRKSAIRVFITRPWFSSGFGEMFGLALWPSSLSELAPIEVDALKKSVCQWGAEVLVRGAPVPEGPFIEHFRNAKFHLSGVSIPGSSYKGKPVRVDVVAFEPIWNDERKLWFVDIDIDVGEAFAPWIRFACVRVQPNALPDCHISPAQALTYAQISPTRSLTVTRTPGDRSLIQIVLAGEVPADGLYMGTKVQVRVGHRNQAGLIEFLSNGVKLINLKKSNQVPTLRDSGYHGSVRIAPDEDTSDMVIEIREMLEELHAKKDGLKLGRPIFIALETLGNW